MAGVGDGRGAVGIDSCAEAGGEARGAIELWDRARNRHRADEHAIEMLEHRDRIVGKLVAQRAHQSARIHGSLQALAAHVAHHNQQRIVFERQRPGRNLRRRR